MLIDTERNPGDQDSAEVAKALDAFSEHVRKLRRQGRWVSEAQEKLRDVERELEDAALWFRQQ